jgi:hypothetical protein
VLSIPLLGNRIWLQTAERVTEAGLIELQRAVARLLPGKRELEPGE